MLSPPMTDPTPKQDLGEVCRAAILAGEFSKAEYLLWEYLRDHPRAPMTTYLLGLAILCQRRFAEARRLIDRAYELRLWLADRFATPMAIEILKDAADAIPGWTWPLYQLERERWRSVGLSLESAATHLVALRRPVEFVQIGANDGKKGDPLHALVRRLELRGLLVEPQPVSFAKLRENYAGVEGLQFENAAIAEEDGPVVLTTTSDRETIGSLLPDRNILKLGRHEVEQIRVNGLRFDTLLAKHGIERFDLLQIDTEGFDYRVLRQVDLASRGVKVVNLEYYCLPVSERLAACEGLRAAGFASFFGEMDMLSVRRDVFEDAFCITDLLRPAPT